MFSCCCQQTKTSNSWFPLTTQPKEIYLLYNYLTSRDTNFDSEDIYDLVHEKSWCIHCKACFQTIPITETIGTTMLLHINSRAHINFADKLHNTKRAKPT